MLAKMKQTIQQKNLSNGACQPARIKSKAHTKQTAKANPNRIFLTNTVGITQMFTGEKQAGNLSINMYDRTQYLKDIQLMKELGLSSYRMFLDWSRIINQ